MPLKVLYIVPPSKTFAGIERVTHEIGNALMRAFIDEVAITVLYSNEYSELGTEPTLYQLKFGYAPKLRNMPLALRRELIAQRYDVIVMPQCEPSVLCWPIVKAFGRGAKYVVHLHGHPVQESRKSTRAKILISIFRLLMAPRIAAVFAVSASQAKFLASYLSTTTPIIYLPNPVRRVNEPVRGFCDQSAPRFLSIGRLAIQKGHDQLIRAFRIVRDSSPTAHLTILGEGPERQNLEELVKELGLAGAVDLPGHIAEQSEFYSLAACFVLASRWEGAGVVFVEALQAGLPIIATDCEFGPSDLIVDDRIGKYVAVDDVAALAVAMEDLIERGAPTSDDIKFRIDRTHEYRPAVAAIAHFNALRSVANENQS